MKLLKNKTERFLHRIHPRDYILDGSTLIRCYDREIIDIPAGITVIDKVYIFLIFVLLIRLVVFLYPFY
jgi:hypothetical protein